MEEKKKEKIKSKRFNMYFEAEIVGKKYVLPHSSLEKFATDNNIKTEMSVISPEKNHPLVMCEVQYDKINIKTVGEATENTLWTDTAKDYPVTIAWARAMDRAIIKLLDFDEMVCSDKEINTRKKKKKTIENWIPSEEPAVPEEYFVDNIHEIFNTQKEDVVEDVPATSEEKPIVKKAETKEETTPDISPDTVILFGKYKGRKFQEITDEEFSKYTAFLRKENVSFADKKKSEQLEYLLKKYA